MLDRGNADSFAPPSFLLLSSRHPLLILPPSLHCLPLGESNPAAGQGHGHDGVSHVGFLQRQRMELAAEGAGAVQGGHVQGDEWGATWRDVRNVVKSYADCA